MDISIANSAIFSGLEGALCFEYPVEQATRKAVQTATGKTFTYLANQAFQEEEAQKKMTSRSVLWKKFAISTGVYLLVACVMKAVFHYMGGLGYNVQAYGSYISTSYKVIAKNLGNINEYETVIASIDSIEKKEVFSKKEAKKRTQDILIATLISIPTRVVVSALAPYLGYLGVLATNQTIGGAATKLLITLVISNIYAIGFILALQSTLIHLKSQPSQAANKNRLEDFLQVINPNHPLTYKDLSKGSKLA